MASATIAYEVADAVATITLDRPEQLNALDPTMERELLQVWDLVDADDAVRAVVVTGRGRAFCAGADLSDAGAGFDVAEALEAGLVRSVHPPDELLSAAYAMARGIVERSAPASVALNRPLLWQMAGAAHPMEAHRQESIYIARRGPSADAEDGARSFLEKRAPSFPLQASTDLPPATLWQAEPAFDRRRR